MHKTITTKALDFLSSNKPYARTFLETQVNGKTYRQIINDASSEPDQSALTNSEIVNNSDCKNYNFEASISKDLNAAADVLFTGLFPFVALKPLDPISASFNIASGNTVKGLVLDRISKMIVASESSNLAELKKATQHTYVRDEGVFGNSFNDVSVAPYCAQAEYNLAVAAWKANNKSEAMRRLGRTLHYVQDITVPHHISLDSNLPDVCRAAVEYVRVGGANIKVNSSQYRYEKLAVEQYLTLTYTPSSMDGFVSNLQQNDARKSTVPQELIKVKSLVQQSGCIGQVDGYSFGVLAKSSGLLGWAKKLWNQIAEGVKDFTQDVVDALTIVKNNLVNFVRDKAADGLKDMTEEALNKTYKYNMIIDDMPGAASKLVPIAIVESAKLIDKFAFDVGLDKAQMGPIYNLLLD